jgi:hypothetical protein
MACGAKEMVDMNHKLTNYIIAQDKKDKKSGKKNKKDKKKGKDDSDDDKKKKKDKKDKKKDKKDKKKDKKDSEENGDDDKGYLKEAVFGKKEDDLGIVSDDDDDKESVASEAGVDDEGAMGKWLFGFVAIKSATSVLITYLHVFLLL